MFLVSPFWLSNKGKKMRQMWRLLVISASAVMTLSLTAVVWGCEDEVNKHDFLLRFVYSHICWGSTLWSELSRAEIYFWDLFGHGSTGSFSPLLSMPRSWDLLKKLDPSRCVFWWIDSKLCPVSCACMPQGVNNRKRFSDYRCVWNVQGCNWEGSIADQEEGISFCWSHTSYWRREAAYISCWVITVCFEGQTAELCVCLFMYLCGCECIYLPHL